MAPCELRLVVVLFCFFFDDAATTGIYTLSLHDALPIYRGAPGRSPLARWRGHAAPSRLRPAGRCRSEEHTSELQSRLHLVCRLLLEKKKQRQARTGRLLPPSS